MNSKNADSPFCTLPCPIRFLIVARMSFTNNFPPIFFFFSISFSVTPPPQADVIDNFAAKTLRPVQCWDRNPPSDRPALVAQNVNLSVCFVFLLEESTIVLIGRALQCCDSLQNANLSTFNAYPYTHCVSYLGGLRRCCDVPQ